MKTFSFAMGVFKTSDVNIRFNYVFLIIKGSLL